MFGRGEKKSGPRPDAADADGAAVSRRVTPIEDALKARVVASRPRNEGALSSVPQF